MWNSNTALIRALLLVFVFLFSSCVATKRDISAINRQIQIINNQIYKLDGIRENQADIGAEMESVKAEMQRLSGKLEENRYIMENKRTDPAKWDARLAALEKKMDSLYRQLDLKPQTEALEQPAAPGTGTNQTAISGVSERETRPDRPENTLYDETLALYREGRYEEALLGFKNFVQRFPQSDLADNAQFWIGECYMSMNQYEQAIHAFHEVEIRYPKGNKVPNAMLKQAMAFLKVKDAIAAKIVLKKLIKNYPDSAEGRIAAAKLETLH